MSESAGGGVVVVVAFVFNHTHRVVASHQSRIGWLSSQQRKNGEGEWLITCLLTWSSLHLPSFFMWKERQKRKFESGREFERPKKEVNLSKSGRDRRKSRVIYEKCEEEELKKLKDIFFYQWRVRKQSTDTHN